MNAYELKQEARRDRMEARAENLRAQAATDYRKADLREEFSGIPFGQPILVGHHSEGRHRRAIERADNAMRRAIDSTNKAAELEHRAAHPSTAISSDDPDATDKLREKLAKLEAEQEQMKAANKLVRSKDRAGLVAMFESEKVADGLLTPDFCGRLGFAGYQLTNNNANIRRIKDRITDLERNSGREEKELLHNSGVRMVENVEANRVQLFFPSKPSEEIRTRLKRSGFRWSPMEGAWQRQLNGAGVYAAQQILASLTEEAAS